MEAIRKKKNSTSSIAIINSFSNIHDLNRETNNDKIIQVTLEFQNSLKVITTKIESLINECIQGYKNTGDARFLANELHELINKHKKKTEEIVDLYYDKIISLGEEFPEEQSVILFMADMANSLLNEHLNEMSEIIKAIVDGRVNEEEKNISVFFDNLIRKVSFLFKNIFK
ncbi:hypothetical protein EDD73_13526 [Heliophilum fasciatum]|uniref:Hemerythrin HHE cation binding domain-containing protein n=2 Tax=Heliophilum fasciatum TaxID=35700 RepID=A0A4R2RE44_9FIRM|nr:hypothetical protein EDD73_13526 [Heliophilum fasciatum]